MMEPSSIRRSVADAFAAAMCRAEEQQGALSPLAAAAAKQQKTEAQPYVKVRGRLVDLSAFKHPGGNVINYFYGLDATNAFDAFHGHSRRAEIILKSLPDLAEEPADAIKQPEAHVSAMAELYADWRARGLFEPRPVSAGLYGLAVTATIVLTWVLAPTYPVMAGLLVGLAWAHCGFLQHMGGHRELGWFSLPWQHFFEGLLKGGSASWWRNRHNKHHAKTNVIGEDGDLRTTPFFAWDATLAKKVHSWSLATQAFTFIPALGAYVFLFAFTVRKYVVVKNMWHELALMVSHYALFSAALAKAGCTLPAALTYYCIGYAFQGIYLGFFFALSHFAVERLDSSTTWLDQAMRGTVDWACDSAFAGYVSGFLNVQIEHHMAPQMPMENLRHVAKDCKKLAAKLDLPHRDLTFLGAVRLMLGGLYTVGREELQRRKSVTAAAAAVLDKLHAD